ncbi:MAG TPA: hypothetical protein VHV49_22325 [Pseudonocardiaceae bacterium]|nr:hypothetical protein [Pseudonocardiaceae bacterium]
MEFNRKTGGNPFDALVQTKVQKKVATKPQQQAPKVVQPKPKSALERRRDDLWDEIDALLSATPWQKNDNTYTQSLNGKVLSNNHNLSAHVTINIDDVHDACYHAGQAHVRRNVFAATPFHVTFEVSDDLSAPENPRWYSDNRKWVIAGDDHVGLDQLNDAKNLVQQGRGIINVLRT